MTAPAKNMNLVDAIQAGVRFVTGNIATIFKSAAPAIVLYAVIYLILKLWISHYERLNALTAFRRQPDYTPAFMVFILGIVAAIVGVIFLVYLSVLFYRQATDAPKPGYGWRFGSADPPLLGLRQDEFIAMKAGLARVWRLWPLVVALLCLSFAHQLNLLEARSRSSDGYGAVAFILNIVGLILIFGGFWAVCRYYLFMAPVVVETGEADVEKIKEPMPGRFFFNVFSMNFLKCFGFLFVAYLPIEIVGWIMDQFYSEAVGARDAFNSNNVFVVFLDTILRTAVTVVAVAFAAGALALIWKQLTSTPGADATTAETAPATTET